MLALRREARAINISAEHIHVEFHERRAPRVSQLDVHQDRRQRGVPGRTNGNANGLRTTAGHSGAGGDWRHQRRNLSGQYRLFNQRYLTEMKPLLGEALRGNATPALFFESSYPTVRITRCGGPS